MEEISKLRPMSRWVNGLILVELETMDFIRPCVAFLVHDVHVPLAVQRLDGTWPPNSTAAFTAGAPAAFQRPQSEQMCQRGTAHNIWPNNWGKSGHKPKDCPGCPITVEAVIKW